ncbi:hypothetical protein PCL1606_23130 [Pseudomonas chlororaphis]|uniref:Uncharacterized protein n=1 Tax=Pseudomonas chlororaphis TaxID=587753 RepID=A0A0D5XXH7_9PSED|nr:hypothetical protein PCL1606_23130 [Pseudomonas chlororaphis]
MIHDDPYCLYCRSEACPRCVTAMELFHRGDTSPASSTLTESRKLTFT